MARKGISWSGTPLNLFLALTKIAGKAAAGRWPKSIHTFGMELRRIAPQLRLHGLSINFERRRGDRIITLSSDGPNNTSQLSTTVPPS